MEKLFFEILQVAIGTRTELSRTLSDAEWKRVYEMAKRQALVGICFVGCQKTLSSSPLKGENLPEVLRLQWLGMAAKIQQRNQVVNAACVELVRQYTRDGLACCILKGQGNLVNYPEGLREARNLGDIDVWCTPQDPRGIEIAISDFDGKGAHYETYSGARGVIEYALLQARLAGKHVPEVRYNHVELPNIWKADVEIHHRPAFLCSPVRNLRLKRWYSENEQFGLCDADITQKCQTLLCKKSAGELVGLESIPIPTNSFNAVYQLVHIYTHLFDEGIGLRQLLDYYFVLRSLHVEQGEFSDRTQSIGQWAEGMGIGVKSNAELIHTIGRLGMRKFAGAVMYVLQEVFGMPDDYLICQPNQKEGKFLLNEIMQAGNFGKYDERIKHGGKKSQHAWEKTKHNLRLLTHYPEEVICEPFFRVYHWFWRRFELWRY